jgi:DNA-damage-inducible protein D
MDLDDGAIAGFEEQSRANGFTWWSARWLQVTLGYASWASFRNVLGKAMSTCLNLSLDAVGNFQPYHREGPDGRNEEDIKLSRFACFLVASHADSKKPRVGQLQAYLASVAAAAIELDPDVLGRLEERGQLSTGERAMTSAAKQAGVPGAALGIFKDEGYLGLYNMRLQELKRYKGFDLDTKRTLYDHMGITELAANSFRVTQTAERLKRTGARGTRAAGQIARQVGHEVRSTMLTSAGVAPEDLPLEGPLSEAKKDLKATSRQMAKLDKPRKKRAPASLPRE